MLCKGAVINLDVIGFQIDFSAKCQQCYLNDQVGTWKKLPKTPNPHIFWSWPGVQNSKICDKSQDMVMSYTYVDTDEDDST